MNEKDHKPATIAAQAAGAVEAQSGGVVPGISLATTYLRDADYELMRPDNVYGRDQNDTVRQCEEVLRALEGAAASLLFPSGMAAIAAVFRALPSGARVVMQNGIYWGTLKWVRDYDAPKQHTGGVPSHLRIHLRHPHHAFGCDHPRLGKLDRRLLRRPRCRS